MPLDAVVLTALRGELAGPLTGARIDRISMPEKDMLVLSVHSPAGNRRLLASVRPGAARVHFTEQTFENPAQPPMFCMLLRKYLTGARVAAVEQPEMERLLRFELDTVDEMGDSSRKQLVVELMGKALNIVLVGDGGRILDCLRRVSYEESGRRPMLPGLFYEPPGAQAKPNFFTVTDAECRRLWAEAPAGAEGDKWLLDTFGGFSPLICRELALDGWARLPDSMEALRRRVAAGDFRPTMLLEQGSPRDFTFLPLRQYGAAREQVPYDSFCRLLDDFYSRRDQQESMRRRASELTRTVKTAHDRLLRKLAAREQELRDTEKRDEYRRRGDMITANLYRLRKGMTAFEAVDYEAEGCPPVTVALDPLKTPQQNAALNYKLYAKAKTANRVLTELTSSSREESAYLESVLDELARAEGERDLGDIRRELLEGGYLREKTGARRTKLPAPRRPLRYVSDTGTEILVGRGNAQNDELTFRIARRTDLWLHVQKIPGSHVIVSQAMGPADETTLRQAASLAVTHSQAGGGRAAVDYTQVRHVKKPAGAKPGRVVYTEYSTILAEADEALGKRLADGK